MEAQMDAPYDRKRLPLVATISGLVLAAAITVYLVNANRGKSGGSSAGSAAAATATAKAGDKKDADKEKAPIPVSVAGVEVGPVSSYITATANLVPENEVKVLAEADGRVSQLNVMEGTRVAAGQVLAALAHEDEEILVNKAQLKETNARLAYERAERAAGQELISREALDRVTLDYEVAKQELAEAQWNLTKTVIKAPFAGRITARMITLGQHVRPGDDLFTVTDFDPLIARIYLPEKDIIGLQEGRDVRIVLKAAEDVHFRGRVRQISPVVDTATGTVKLTIEAVDPPAEVRPGGFVTIDIVRETHPNALLVPREAVIRELNKAHVFIAQDGVAKKREVTLALEEGGRVEATSGLVAGERVIVAGQGSLKDGAAISVLGPAATPAAATSTAQGTAQGS